MLLAHAGARSSALALPGRVSLQCRRCSAGAIAIFMGGFLCKLTHESIFSGCY